jgi:hypothetical protein
MPRTSNDERGSVLNDQILQAFRETTREQRSEIARQWCLKNFAHIEEFRHLSSPPIALIIASLIDMDHPLLVSSGRGVMWSAMKCALLVLRVELFDIQVEIPLGEIVHTDPQGYGEKVIHRGVENCGEPVETPVMRKNG